jgi:thiamine-phosphate pyrophosphorylase
MPRRKKPNGIINGSTARLLDANLNRAREGLRVCEDTARFLWNDKILYLRLRGLRHRLDAITRLHYPSLVKSRNSSFDVGRSIKEKKRDSIGGVVASNIRRTQEALRVLEEYAKVLSRRNSGEFKRIRFQLYSEEKRLLNNI